MHIHDVLVFCILSLEYVQVLQESQQISFFYVTV